MECFKCRKQLGESGLNARFKCVDCENYFCPDDILILDNIKGIRGNIYHVARCYDCQATRDKEIANKDRKTNEQIKSELEKEQDKNLVKQAEEKRKAEILKQEAEEKKKEAIAKAEAEKEVKELVRRQKEHSAELVLPRFKKVEITKEFNQFKPCSGYLDRYGEKGAITTEIFISVYYEDSEINEEKGYFSETTKGEKKFYCAKCSQEARKKINKNLEEDIENRQDPVKERMKEILSKNY